MTANNSTVAKEVDSTTTNKGKEVMMMNNEQRDEEDINGDNEDELEDDDNNNNNNHDDGGVAVASAAAVSAASASPPGSFKNSYLEMVAAKRARNEAMIQKLGFPNLRKKKMAAIKKNTPPTKKTKKKKYPARPVRQSLRIRKEGPPTEFLELVDFPDENSVGQRRRRPGGGLRPQIQSVPPRTPPLQSKDSTRSSILRPDRRVHTVTPEPSLSVQDIDRIHRRSSSRRSNRNKTSSKTTLSSPPTWLDDFRYYLKEVDGVSCSNESRVLSSVTKLATGQGIGYRHWPAHIVFAQDCSLDPTLSTSSTTTTSLEEWYDLAIHYEATYGRDRGNGWLLLHPIQKLMQYQQWLHEGQQQEHS